MNYLWKVTAKRDSGKTTKGMSVEILKKGTSGKPTPKEIANALNDKYGTDIPSSHCAQGYFDFEKLS